MIGEAMPCGLGVAGDRIGIAVNARIWEGA
jgi:hypothetical protein